MKTTAYNDIGPIQTTVTQLRYEDLVVLNFLLVVPDVL